MEIGEGRKEGKDDFYIKLYSQSGIFMSAKGIKGFHFLYLFCGCGDTT